MCSNYQPVIDPDLLLGSFGVALPQALQAKTQAQAAGLSPFIVAADAPAPGDATPVQAQARYGLFGLLPPFAEDVGLARHTQHCAAERMKSRPAFRESWWAGRRCVIPAQWITAWSYESGWPSLWRIQRVDGQPLGLAGLWTEWVGPTGECLPSFTLLTLGAEGHEVFGRMGAPDQPRRMPVVLSAGLLTLWLHGSLKDAERQLQRCPAALLRAEPHEWATVAGGREPRRGAAMPDLFAPEWGECADDELPAPLSQVRRRPPLRRVEPAGPITGELF